MRWPRLQFAVWQRRQGWGACVHLGGPPAFACISALARAVPPKFLRSALGRRRRCCPNAAPHVLPRQGTPPLCFSASTLAQNSLARPLPLQPPRPLALSRAPAPPTSPPSTHSSRPPPPTAPLTTRRPAQATQPRAPMAAAPAAAPTRLSGRARRASAGACVWPQLGGALNAALSRPRSAAAQPHLWGGPRRTHLWRSTWRWARRPRHSRPSHVRGAARRRKRARWCRQRRSRGACCRTCWQLQTPTRPQTWREVRVCCGLIMCCLCLCW
jgi:hypothetical protein